MRGGKETNKDSPSNGERSGNSSSLNSLLLATANCSLQRLFQTGCTVLKLLGMAHRRGWQSCMWHIVHQPRSAFYALGWLGMQPKMGSKLLLKLNIGTRPIAKKYREGKMKSTLKRKLIVTWNLHCWDSDKFCSVMCIVRIQMDRLSLSSDRRTHFLSVCANSCWNWFKSPGRRQPVLVGVIACVWYANLNPREDFAACSLTACSALELRQAVVEKSVPRLLAVIWFHATRHEIRAKESNMCVTL